MPVDLTDRRRLQKLTPFTAPAFKISGLKDAGTRLQNSIVSGTMTSTVNAVCFDENPFICQCEKEDKQSRVSNFALLSVVFKCQHGSDGVFGEIHVRENGVQSLTITVAARTDRCNIF